MEYETDRRHAFFPEDNDEVLQTHKHLSQCVGSLAGYSASFPVILGAGYASKSVLRLAKLAFSGVSQIFPRETVR